MDKSNSEGGSTYSIPRRSQRVEVSIPVTLIGKDSSGREFRENTRTVVVNKHGAKIATTHHLELESEVTVENRKLGKKAKGKIAWLGESLSARDPLQVGVQLYEAENIWGIEFPPEDWEDAVRKAFVPKESSPAELSASEAAISGQGPSEVAQSAGEIPFSLRDAIEAAASDFEKRLGEIAGLVGKQAGDKMASASEVYQQKLQSSMDEFMRTAVDKIDAASSKLEELLRQTEAARENALRESEQAHAEIRAAATRAVNEGLETIAERISKDLENRQAALTASIADQISQASLERAGKAVEEHIAKLLPDFEAEIIGKLTERLNAESERSVTNTREQLDDSAQKAAAGMDSTLRDRAQTFSADAEQQIKQSSTGAIDQLRQGIASLVEESVGQARDQLNQLTATSVEENLAEVKKRMAEAVEEAYAAKHAGAKDSAIEEIKRRLASLSKGTAEAMNKEAAAGLERYNSALRKKAEAQVTEAAERLKKASQDAIAEATVLFRSSLAGVFSSVSSGAKKSGKKESS